MATEKIAKKFTVTGKVQGVFFRKYTQAQANKLKLIGWVANQADGSVAGEVAGEVAATNEFTNWLKTGSPQARVELVQVEDISFELAEDIFKLTDFQIRG